MSNHTLLFVDDEEGILKSLRRLFLDEDYDIETASSGKEALERVRTKEISLVISDDRMPGIRGVEFLKRVKSEFPRTVRILLTGHADLEAAIGAVNEGNVYRFFTKPWEDEDLRLTVKNGLRQYEIERENRRLARLLKERNQMLRDLNRNLELRVEERTREIVRLNEELEKGLIDSIRVFIDLIELHDASLGAHSKRVALISKELAKRMDMADEEILDIEIAGLLHDIGTIGIPAYLLKKADYEITPTEKAIIRQHPIIGQETVAKIMRLDKVSKIIRHHHETFDGKGYPDRFHGDEIPLGSRIVAVANVFDRLANRRNPQSGVGSKEWAIGHIERNRTVSFDPRVVDVLLEYLGNVDGLTDGEVHVTLSELTPGMVLSRDLKTGQGRLLVSKGTALQASQIEKVHNFHRIDPITERIYVYQSP